MVLLGCFSAFCVASRRAIKIGPALNVLILWITHLCLTLFAALFTSFASSLLNTVVVMTYTIFCITILWSECDYDSFEASANAIGILASVFLFVQAAFLVAGLEPPSGRLFNLELLGSASFVATTWGFRLNSFFQEPSYFAIYVLPLLATSLRRNQHFRTVIFGFALVLSSSSLAIIGSIIVVVVHIASNRGYWKRAFIGSFSGIALHIVLSNSVSYYALSVTRSLQKLSSLSVDSRIRFGGQSNLFLELPFLNQLVGIGLNQMQNYFSRHFFGVYNYSNSMVVTLINSGFIGLIVYLAFVIRISIKSVRSKRGIFVLIFLLVASVDYLIYNHFFFYLLAFISLINESGWDS